MHILLTVPYLLHPMARFPAPRYGYNKALQDSVRTFEGGKLKKDVIADNRFTRATPPVVFLRIFNRWVP
jgi:hypothetical protein